MAEEYEEWLYYSGTIGSVNERYRSLLFGYDEAESMNCVEENQMLEDLREEFQQQRRESQNWYDTAQICPNGHVITEFAASQRTTQKEFCNRCGEKTLMACEKCTSPIQGHRHTRTPYLSVYQTPRFCHRCGAMFPWTALYLEEARELVEELRLSEKEKAELKQSIEHLAKGVKTEVAKEKFKRLLIQGGQQLSGAFLSVMTNVVSAELIKTLLPK